MARSLFHPAGRAVVLIVVRHCDTGADARLAIDGRGRLDAYLRSDRQRQNAPAFLWALKALAVDVERNLRAPLAGIANVATKHGHAYTTPQIAIRTGDTPPQERARFLREPADSSSTIHALVPNKRGAHMALSLELSRRMSVARRRRAEARRSTTDRRQVADRVSETGTRCARDLLVSEASGTRD